MALSVLFFLSQAYFGNSTEVLSQILMKMATGSET
jgi:hypothetical protein